MTRTFLSVVLIASLFGCGKEEKKTPPAPVADSPALEGLTLAADPGDALSVEDAKAAAPGSEVVAVGRIRNIVKGFASFQLTDTGLDYCGSGADQMEQCPTPWDYCCLPQGEVNEATLLVEARDEKGEALAAGKLPGLRRLDLVVVKGKLAKDEHGNVTIEATGWHRRERPKLHDKVRWPE